MLRDLAEDRLATTIGNRAEVACRNTSRWWTDSRSFRGGVLPARPASDSLFILGISKNNAFEFLGLINSAVFDFLVRGKMPGPNIKTTWVLSQVAVPVPGIDPLIATNSRKLSLTSSAIAREFGAESHPWDPEERYALDVETDALVAHAYGVAEKEYMVIMDTFDVLARKEVAAYGCYRFKEDCLDAYRRLK
jgi:hypothetical protein